MCTEVSGLHKFDRDSGLSSQAVFDFAFKEKLIPILQNLEDEAGVSDYLEAVAAASTRYSIQLAQQWAASVPRNDMATWTAWIDDPANPFHDRLTFDVIERTDTVCEIRITECLWAKTFREAAAAAIGYAVCCSGDPAMCQAFNPRMQLIRNKTLMQGDDCCDYRWVLDE
jgi:hypothetical protein